MIDHPLRMNPYETPLATVTFEQVIKNSRFICNLGHAVSPVEARTEIQDIRNNHPKANHVCWAYIAGPPDSFERAMSDDGEPHSTAGKPILSILSYSGYGEIWATVTRYFGGVKLGTGGLVRAYGSSVKQAIALVRTQTREIMLPCKITIEYNILGVLELILAEEKVEIVERIYTENISFDLLLPQRRFNQILQRLNEISSGNSCISSNPNGHGRE